MTLQRSGLDRAFFSPLSTQALGPLCVPCRGMSNNKLGQILPPRLGMCRNLKML